MLRQITATHGRQEHRLTALAWRCRHVEETCHEFCSVCDWFTGTWLHLRQVSQDHILGLLKEKEGNCIIVALSPHSYGFIKGIQHRQVIGHWNSVCLVAWMICEIFCSCKCQLSNYVKSSAFLLLLCVGFFCWKNGKLTRVCDNEDNQSCDAHRTCTAWPMIDSILWKVFERQSFVCNISCRVRHIGLCECLLNLSRDLSH